MALTNEQVKTSFGSFTYREVGGGLVAPEAGWLARNIVTARAPFPLPSGKGKTEKIRCHRLVAGQIIAALQELEARGLRRLLRSYDGCYLPRHICWDQARPLSRHAWGIALDLNAAQFPFGSARRQDAQLVEVFARHGWRCGQKGSGLWQVTRDPMHFEVVNIVQR